MIDESGTTRGAPAGRRSVADSRPPGSPAVTDGPLMLGALSKAGVPVPPAALIGVPLTVDLMAGMLQRGRRRRVTPNNEVEVVPA